MSCGPPKATHIQSPRKEYSIITNYINKRQKREGIKVWSEAAHQEYSGISTFIIHILYSIFADFLVRFSLSSFIGY